jgi:hypothetical protein
VEAKLLQTAASLDTLFVLVISAEALKPLVAFLELGMPKNPCKISDLAPVMAPFPESLQQRCIAAPGLLAQVIVSKSSSLSSVRSISRGVPRVRMPVPNRRFRRALTSLLESERFTRFDQCDGWHMPATQITEQSIWTARRCTQVRDEGRSVVWQAPSLPALPEEPPRLL